MQERVKEKIEIKIVTSISDASIQSPVRIFILYTRMVGTIISKVNTRLIK